MSTNIRYPNITATDEKGQLLQVKSYLHQLAEQLNWALRNVDGGADSGAEVTDNGSSSSSGGGEISPTAFSELKSLIIKSADIVNAYYEEINTRLEGVYAAESDFGAYKQETSQAISETSTDITRQFENIQEIQEALDGAEKSIVKLIASSAWIKTGLLGYDDTGAGIYGVEVGQRTELGNAEVFNKYARFTADRLSFYDQNGAEVAYISDRKLFINIVQINSILLLGGFTNTVESDGILTYWVWGK